MPSYSNSFPNFNTNYQFKPVNVVYPIMQDPDKSTLTTATTNSATPPHAHKTHSSQTQPATSTNSKIFGGGDIQPAFIQHKTNRLEDKISKLKNSPKTGASTSNVLTNSRSSSLTKSPLLTSGVNTANSSLLFHTSPEQQQPQKSTTNTTHNIPQAGVIESLNFKPIRPQSTGLELLKEVFFSFLFIVQNFYLVVLCIQKKNI